MSKVTDCWSPPPFKKGEGVRVSFCCAPANKDDLLCKF